MSENGGKGTVNIFSAKACAAPLEKAAKFYKEFGWIVPEN